MPKGLMGSMYRDHLAGILSNFAIFFSAAIAIMLFLCVGGSLLIVFGYFLLAMLVLISFGLILLNPTVKGLFESNGSLDAFAVLGEWALKLAPYFFVVTAVCALISIVLYATDKTRPHTGRIVCNSIFLALALICLVVIITVGTGGVQQ